METLIVMVNGYPRSGKDTFCEFASEKYSTYNHSTVDTVKQIAKIMGWDGEKTPEARLMLSDLKDLYVEHFDGSFREIKDLILDARVGWNVDIVFIHAREPEEIERVTEWCITENIRLVKLCVEREDIIPKEGFSNHADKKVMELDYDVVVQNNGTLEEFRLTSLNLLGILMQT